MLQRVTYAGGGGRGVIGVCGPLKSSSFVPYIFIVVCLVPPFWVWCYDHSRKFDEVCA